MLVVPVFLWVSISIAAALMLKGAHFFFLIGLFGTIALLSSIVMRKPLPNLTLLLMAPIILIFSPFLVQLPVALGLKILPYSSLLLVLLLSTFISSIQIPKYFQINKWVFIISLISLYIYAETKSSYSQDQPLPNSLYYFQDNDSDAAYMFTYDKTTDEWNKSFFENNRLKHAAINRI